MYSKNFFKYNKSELLKAISLSLAKPSLGFEGIKLFFEILRSFFLPQFANVIFKFRKVVFVDNKLDWTIPFKPDYIKKYLEFTPLWLGTYYRIAHLKYENKKTSTEVALAFLRQIRILYKDSGLIYRRVHSTTQRPHRYINIDFALILTLDPHLNCMPSLHVLLVITNWKWLESLIKSHPTIYQYENIKTWISFIRSEAVKICECILFIKQHSINCISVSLFYLTQRLNNFKSQDALNFIKDLFSNYGQYLKNVDEIKLEITKNFEFLCSNFLSNSNWKKTIIEYIFSFEEKSKHDHI